MKKGIILIGLPDTGKSRIANLLTAGKKHITIDARNTNLLDDRFTYSYCETDTQVIIFDDLLNFKNQLEKLFNLVTDGVLVDKKGKKSFIIFPQIIVTINGAFSDLKMGASLERRFDVFELSSCNSNYIPLV